jgi:hypothetical protein
MEVTGQLHAPGSFIRKPLAITSVGGCMRLKAGLDVLEKRKCLTHAGNRTLTVQPVVLPYID